MEKKITYRLFLLDYWQDVLIIIKENKEKICMKNLADVKNRED